MNDERDHHSRPPDGPVLKIFLCGPLRLLHRQEHTNADHMPSYQGIPVTEWGERPGPTLNLLKLLLCCDNRHASKTFLAGTLWPDYGEKEARHSLNQAARALRSILRTSEEELKSEAKTKSLLFESPGGEGFQLADQTLLWVDVDAFEDAMKQATYAERHKQKEEALSCWEQAYALGKLGIFLPDDLYQEWTNARRLSHEMLFPRCVRLLAECYLAKERYSEAEEVLRPYWITHLTNEDILMLLMQTLQVQGLRKEALQCYEQSVHALDEELGVKPHTSTTDLADHIREEQRSHKYMPIPLISSFMKEEEAQIKIDMLAPLTSPSLFRTDVDVVARLATVLSKPSAVSEREITYFDQQTRLYWRVREETALPTITLYGYVIRHIDDINMLLSRSLLPMLRSYLCEIVCRTVLLTGILLYDMGQYAKARQQYQVAFQAAIEANNLVLQAIVWGWTSFTWSYDKHYVEALHCIQHARSYAMQTTEVSTKAWLSAIEAEIQAHLYNRDASLQALSNIEHSVATSPSLDIAYLFEFDSILLLGYKGVCLQQFYRRQEPATHGFLQEAKVSLEMALASDAPVKRKIYYLNDLASVYARQGEVETACAYVAQSVPMIINIGSGSKTIRDHLLQARTLLQPHEHTSSVQKLDQYVTPLLLEQ